MTTKTNDTIMVGPHRLLCGDVCKGVVQRLLRGSRVDAVCSEIPWGKRSAEKYIGKNSGFNWGSFQHEFCRAASEATDGPVFVFIRDLLLDRFAEIAVGFGLHLIQQWAAGSPQMVMFHKDSKIGHLKDVKWEWKDTPFGPDKRAYAVLSSLGWDVESVLDPCIGFGGTATAGIRLGMTVYGTEKIPARLEVCRQTIQGMIG